MRILVARLPQPGADDGQWGGILNDYLAVEHTTTGALKLRTDGTLDDLVSSGDARLSDVRIPVDHSVTNSKVAPNAAIEQTKIAGLISDLAAKIPASEKGAPSGVASLDSSGKLNAAQAGVTVPQVQQGGTSYTLVLADAGKLMEFSTATAVTLTVPASTSVAFAAGTVIGVRQYGVGQVTVVGDEGVTLRSRGAATKLAGQYSEATLSLRSGDEWVLSGDLVT